MSDDQLLYYVGAAPEFEPAIDAGYFMSQPVVRGQSSFSSMGTLSGIGSANQVFTYSVTTGVAQDSAVISYQNSVTSNLPIGASMNLDTGVVTASYTDPRSAGLLSYTINTDLDAGVRIATPATPMGTTYGVYAEVSFTATLHNIEEGAGWLVRAVSGTEQFIEDYIVDTFVPNLEPDGSISYRNFIFADDPNFVSAENLDGGHSGGWGTLGEDLPMDEPVRNPTRTVTTSTGDRVEIPTNNATFGALSSGGLYPVVIDLGGDGFDLNYNGEIRFDYDSDGYEEQVAWVGPEDGFLIVDLDEHGNLNSNGGDGDITYSQELVLSQWAEGEVTDLQALAQAVDSQGNLVFDSDGNGVLDSNDDVWASLAIFQDLNQNGDVDEGELMSLDAHQIESISLVNDDGSSFDDTSNDIHVGSTTLLGQSTIIVDGQERIGAAGDISLSHTTDGILETTYSDGIFYAHEDGSENEFFAVMVDGSVSFTNSINGRDDLIGVAGNSSDNLIDLRGVDSGQFINGSGGADVVRGSDYEDIIMGGEGNDTLSGHRDRDVLIGEDGNDRLYGGNGHDQLEGGTGTDRLYGGNGDDILNAGEGTGSWQYLYGGNGDDTYVYETSAGHVFISGDEGATTGTEDGVVFGDLRIQDISFSMHDYGSGHISGNAINFSWSENGESGRLRIGLGGQHIEEYIFADGSRINAIVAAETGVTSSGRSQFVGADSDDLIVNVDNTNAYYLIGGDGDDTLVATVDGAGNNYLGGQSGDDTYVYHQSAGNTWITVWGEATDANGSNDTFVFADLNYADVTFSTYNSGSAQGEVLQANFVDEGVTHYVRFADQGSAIENFEFADGSRINAIVAAETSVTSSGRSQFVGADSDDLIVNVDNTNAYYLIGGDGDDTLVATVDGAGNNYLGGQSGDDTYVYHQSAGNTWITVWGEATDANGSNDTFVFADLNYADVTFSTYNSGSAQGEVLQANFVDEGVTHYVRFADQGSAIENFEFADGSRINAIVAAETSVTSSGRSQFVGADSDDLIVNVDNTNAYYLIGGDGDDTLVATVDGAGNNYLGGQSGDDTYVYHQSAGNTWITVWGEATDANGSNDTFVFADLYYADVTFSTYNSGSAQGEVLQANFVDEGVTHYVRFADQGSAIENFEFADGATLSSYDLIA